MASQGPNSGGTFGTISTGLGASSSDWANPANAAASDNTYTSSSWGSSLPLAESYQLKATNFGFSIPAGATINGITVEIEKKCSSAAFNTKDSTVKLVKGGTVSGTNKASVSVWPTADAYSTYGSSSDLWGLTLTDSDVNASTFGVVISYKCDATNKSSVAQFIDHIRITVAYTASGGGSFIARSNKVIGQAINRASTY